MTTLALAALVALTAAPEPAPTRWIAVMDHTVMRASEQAVEAAGGRTRRCFAAGRVCVFELPAGADGRWVLGAIAGVHSVQPDYAMQVGPFGPQRQSFADAAGTADCDAPWELGPLGLEAMWEEATGQDAPTVMVCDGGFRQSHEDLQGAFVGQWDYGNDDAEAEVEWGVGIPSHGTFIAGLLRATPDNGVGRVGLMPHGRVFAAKTANSSGDFYLSAAIEAMADAAEDPTIRVVSYSLSGNGWDDAFAAAVEGLGAHDTLLVAAAGNCFYPYCLNGNNDKYPEYPASYPGAHVIGVAGVKPGDAWNSYSHWGVKNVDVAAPGTQLCSLGAEADDDTYVAAGTSYATPLVGAVAALLMEARPALSAAEVADILRLTAKRTETLSTKVASGRVDGAAAMAMPWPDLPAPAPATVTASATLAVDNRGAPGAATLVVGHGPQVEIGAPAGWQVQATSDGVTRLTGTLPGPGLVELILPVTAGLGPLELTLRLEAASLLHAEHTRATPLLGDETDATGAPAWLWTLTVVEHEPEPDPEPEPEPEPDLGPTPVDEGPAAEVAEELGGLQPGQDVAVGAEVSPEADAVSVALPDVRDGSPGDGRASGCAGGAAGGAVWLGLAVALWRARRRGVTPERRPL